MRKRFEQQNELDADLIPDIEIDGKSRHSLPKLLAGLQYIFVTPALNEAIFEVLEQKILGGKRATGRLGMSLWEILVLGTMRLNLDYDYDSLYDLSNHHMTVRGILGVHTRQVFSKGKYYPLQTLKDNVSLLDEDALMEISELVVKAGHQLKKNELEGASQAPGDFELHLKADSYAVESNIHFPTDLNLLFDSGRKCLDVIVMILKEVDLPGWRKLKYLRKKFKQSYRTAADIHHRKGSGYQERLAVATKAYLEEGQRLNKRVEQSLQQMEQRPLSIQLMAAMTSLTYYQSMLVKHLDLVSRRILKGETIPHQEKVFSIFEPHVEWIQKGKHGKKVELGHNTLVTTDQYHFIVDHKVMIGNKDAQQPIELSERLSTRFAQHYTLKSISFDRGFYSLLAKKNLQKTFEQVVMPKKGKKTAGQQEEEQDKTFVALRKAHSAVESNINELEHSGVNKVPDKGLPAFKRYVALGVLAYNIKRLGAIVIEQNLLTTITRPVNRRKAA
jgi:hypothetical protein